VRKDSPNFALTVAQPPDQPDDVGSGLDDDEGPSPDGALWADIPCAAPGSAGCAGTVVR
jgi:hypothetical protein